MSSSATLSFLCNLESVLQLDYWLILDIVVVSREPESSYAVTHVLEQVSNTAQISCSTFSKWLSSSESKWSLNDLNLQSFTSGQMNLILHIIVLCYPKREKSIAA